MKRKNNNSISWKKRMPLSTRTKVILAVICLAVLITGLLSAKYVSEKNNDLLASAEHFYFVSDILDGGTHKVAPSENGTAKIELNLMNHDDALRSSEVDINYTVTVEPSEGVTVNNASGTLTKGSVDHEKVTISGLEAGKTYKVTATTDNIYKKTIEGRISVSPIDNKVYATVKDGGAYIDITVWTKDNSEGISLTYPEGLIPDNTNSLMSNWVTAGSGGTTVSGISLGANSSVCFRFFKTVNSKSYDVDGGDIEKPVVIREK